MKFLRSFLSIVVLTSLVAGQVQANPVKTLWTRVTSIQMPSMPKFPKLSMPSLPALPKVQMPTLVGLKAAGETAKNAVVAFGKNHTIVSIAVPAVIAAAGVVYATDSFKTIKNSLISLKDNVKARFA